MLKKLKKASKEKIKTAKKVYEAYLKCNNLRSTSAATGLAINTVRRYIALAEDETDKEKLASKESYYKSNNVEKPENPDIGEEDKEEKAEVVEVISNVVIDENVPSIKEVKDRIVVNKLDKISNKYLDSLDNPNESKLHKTSLKDRAVIAGILIDKRVQLEQKQGGVIKDQSIIFNLFGSNEGLAKFIDGSVARRKKLQAREPKKVMDRSINEPTLGLNN